MKKVFLTIMSLLLGAGIVEFFETKRTNQMQSIIHNTDSLKNVLGQIILNRSDGILLKDYFEFNQAKHIAIYGWGIVGKAVYAELVSSGKCIDFVIDSNAENIVEKKIKVLSLNDKWPEVDFIIVTSIHYFDEIAFSLKNRTDARVISLEEIVYEK